MQAVSSKEKNHLSHDIILAKSKISRLQLAAVAEQAGLSLTWSQTSEDRFCRTAAHSIIRKQRKNLQGVPQSNIAAIVTKKKSRKTPNEPPHEIMALIVFRKLNLQTRMRSHPLELHVWFLVRPFVYFHTLCLRTAKALARRRGCAVSPEPSLFAYAVSTIIS